MLGHQRARWAPGSLDRDFCARQFGVQAGLLAARRVLVAQADEGARRGMDAAGDVGLPHAIERKLLSRVTQHEHGQARAPDRSELDLRGSGRSRASS